MASQNNDSVEASSTGGQPIQVPEESKQQLNPRSPEGDDASVTEPSNERPHSDTNHNVAGSLTTRLKAIEQRMQELEGPPSSDGSDFDSDDLEERVFPFRRRRELIRNMEYLVKESTRVFKHSRRFDRRYGRSGGRKKNENAVPDSTEDDRLDRVEEYSKAALSGGESAKLVWVNWETFIDRDIDIEDAVTTPIQAVASEPEPHIVLSPMNRALAVGKKQVPSETFLAKRYPEKEPLPERIHLRSQALYAIIKRRVSRSRALDPSSAYHLVLLRPYRVLVYDDKKLREYLSFLEQSFGDPSKLSETSQAVSGSDPAAIESTGEGQIRAQSIFNTPTPVDRQKVPRDDSDTDTEDEASDGDIQPFMRNSANALLHLRCLINFMDNNIKPTLDYLASDKCKDVYFHDLWHLFKPGTEIIDQMQKQAYRVVRVQAARHRVEPYPWLRWSKATESDDETEDESLLKINCAFIDFDGKQFGPVTTTFTITPFSGLQAVTNLPVYPLRLAKNRQLRSDLIERGKTLLSVSKFRSMYYTGHTLDSREEVDSQVVVDFEEALTAVEDWTPKFSSLKPTSSGIVQRCKAPCCNGLSIHDDEYVDAYLAQDFIKTLIPEDTTKQASSLLLTPRSLNDSQSGSGDKPSDEELVVMTFRVFGFVLRTRKWAKLDLTFLRAENVDANKATRSAFDQLALPDGHRAMVKSLVTQHFRARHSAAKGIGEDEQFDLIRGKGKGLIILLHGAPGVGKTTTAEGVAEHFQKPLFTITSGDLGTTAQDVDNELGKNFALASRWGCILLIDEAEVFLAAREKKDIQRNGLVAVFLRVLEYYTGILFLTTNRVGEFDEAFASRINMSLYYPELNEEKTKKIFELNLNLIRERFTQQGRKIIYDASSIENFAEQHFRQYDYCRWNGRQIRNLCQTALALAEFDAQGGNMTEEVGKNVTVELQLKHFSTVQTAYVHFAFYMGDVRGTKGDRRAYDSGYRAKKEDTPYYSQPNLLSGRAEEMHRSRQQPSSMSTPHHSAYGDQYDSPSSRRPQGHQYRQSQYARAPRNPQQEYEFPGEPQRQSAPRFYGQEAQQEAVAYNAPEQPWEVPIVQFNQSPSGRPAQVSGQYPRRQPQHNRGDLQGAPQAYTVPGDDDLDDTFGPPGLRGGPGGGAGRGMGSLL